MPVHVRQSAIDSILSDSQPLVGGAPGGYGPPPSVLCRENDTTTNDACAGACHTVVILNYHGRDDTVSQTLVKSRAKVKMKVQDASSLLEQISEWMDDRDLGRTVGDDLSVVSDMSVVRDLWRKRGREDGGTDDTGSASRDNGTSKR